jgi:xylulokinase
MKLLGIDVGTGGTRAVAVDEGGQVVASATSEHEPFASPQIGWAEQDPRDWWRATTEAVRGVLAQGVGADEIACVGFSGQMHGAVMLDERDEVLRPALIWCDQRTDPQCRAITERVGAERLIELTSNPALTNFTLTKLLWVREHQPEMWARFNSILLPKDYVRLRLTGERATDVADASGTLLLDVANRRWSDAMLDALELERSSLPALFESPEITGRVSAGARRRRGCARARRSWPARATRPRARSAWASCGPERSAPPSAPRASSSRRPRARRWTRRGASTPSATPSPAAGT